MSRSPSDAPRRDEASENGLDAARAAFFEAQRVLEDARLHLLQIHAETARSWATR